MEMPSYLKEPKDQEPVDVPSPTKKNSLPKSNYAPKIKLTKNFRRNIKTTKVILGNGGDHCGVTMQLNALAVG
jgi:hypothetical protein